MWRTQVGDVFRPFNHKILLLPEKYSLSTERKMIWSLSECQIMEPLMFWRVFFLHVHNKIICPQVIRSNLLNYSCSLNRFLLFILNQDITEWTFTSLHLSDSLSSFSHWDFTFNHMKKIKSSGKQCLTSGLLSKSRSLQYPQCNLATVWVTPMEANYQITCSFLWSLRRLYTAVSHNL